MKTSLHPTSAGLIMVAIATAPLAPGKVVRLARTVEAETLHRLTWSYGPKILEMLASDLSVACEKKACAAFGFPTATVFTIS